MQVIFRLAIYALISALLYLIGSVYFVYHGLKNTKPSTLDDLPEFGKIYWIPIVSAIALYGIRRLIHIVAKPLLFHITKDKEDKDVWLARADRSSLFLFKFSFYVASSIWAF